MARPKNKATKMLLDYVALILDKLVQQVSLGLEVSLGVFLKTDKVSIDSIHVQMTAVCCMTLA